MTIVMVMVMVIVMVRAVESLGEAHTDFSPPLVSPSGLTLTKRLAWLILVHDINIYVNNLLILIYSKCYHCIKVPIL